MKTKIDIKPHKKGFKVVGEEIVNLPLEPYRVTEKEFLATKGKRILRIRIFADQGYGRFSGTYIFGSYDEFDPCFIKYNGKDNIQLKKYIWSK